MKLNSAEKKHHKGQMLASSEIVDYSHSCPVCQSTAPRESVFQLQESPPITLLICATCRGVSASHMPSPAKVQQIYESFYSESDDEKYTFHGIERLASHILKYVHIKPGRHRFKILEIGGGDGTLCKEIGKRIHALNRQIKVEVSEVELYDGKSFDSENFSIQFYADLKNIEGRFDLVIASAVLHQIPELYEVMHGLFERVQLGGVFFARTAFIFPLTRLFRSLIDPLYPYHVHDLGCEFWSRVTHTFSLPAKIICSKPSLVELQVRRAPVRAIAAHVLKLPANLELSLFKSIDHNPFWKFVGGWEVFVQFDK